TTLFRSPGDAGTVPGGGVRPRLPFRRTWPAPPRGCARRGAGRDGEDARLPRPAARGMDSAVLGGAAQPDHRPAAPAQLPPEVAERRARRGWRRDRLGRRVHARPGARARRPRGLGPPGRRPARTAGAAPRGVHPAGARGHGRGNHREDHGLQRGLGQDPPVPRPPGPAEATGGVPMNIDDTGRFDLAARRAYADAQARVSAGTMAQLHRRRHAVLSAPARPRWRLPAAAFASLLVLGAGLGIGLRWAGDAPPPPPVAQATVPAAATDPGIEAVLDDLDQNPEFYVWLASRDADLLAME